MTVTALLVCHEGARWLPAVLEGLAAQVPAPDAVVAVDTAAQAGDTALLSEALSGTSLSGTSLAGTVRHRPGSFPEAVAEVLPSIDTDWVWVLHDDSNPAPGALAALLETASAQGADVVGPKLREWPSLRRLLEVGVTMSGTGRRETGLERGEYDQGQHDQAREVLAVNTAGMLVRREVLERLQGFDPELPLFGTDLDFGWRAARAGFRTVVAPDAVVFHAEAAHRGQRRTPIIGRRTRTHRLEREAALFTLLANARRGRVLLTGLRLLLAGVLRMIGYLLSRQPGIATDEASALLRVLGRPGRIRAARRARRAQAGDQPVDVRPLLAPWWTPYRHGLDSVTDLVDAASAEGRDAAERRRAARLKAAGRPAPRQDDDELDLGHERGWFARTLSNPTVLVLAAFALITVWGARAAFGPLAGGALSPAPDATSDWWQLVGQGWHPLAQGTDAPAPGYLLPFATAATLLFGHPDLVVSLIFLLSVPAAAWGAWRFLRVVAELGSARPRSAVITGWGAITYALVPVASGAWGQGRFGVLLAAALLPWLASAALGLLEPSADRRWRAGWRSGALLALITALTPVAWLISLTLVLMVVVAGLVIARDLVRDRSVWGPLLVTIAAPPLLLLPGTVGLITRDVSAMFLEAGRLAPVPGNWDLLAGRFADPAAPAWWGFLLAATAVAVWLAATLMRLRSRFALTVCWLLVAEAALLAALLGRISIDLPMGETRPGLGFLLILIQAALITSIVIGMHGLAVAAPDEEAVAGPRRLVAGALAVAALVVPLASAGWWFAVGDDQLGRPSAGDVPAYMRQSAADDDTRGILLLRGSVDRGVDWTIQRGDGVTLGEDEILALTPPDPDVDAKVRDALTLPGGAGAAGELADYGVEFIVMPTPVDQRVAARLDAASGVEQASSADDDSRAWRVAGEVDPQALDGEGPWWHPWLLGLQVMAIIAIAVLCGPTRREARR